MKPNHSSAIRHLRRQDSRMGEVIRTVGPCTLQRSGGSFELLARSILSQQISVAAARTIRRRLQAALPQQRLSAAGIIGLSEAELTAVGVSKQKRGYLLDLCGKVQAGQLNFRRIAQVDNESVITELTAVKGIGRWTAQMFLLFGLGRPDIFAPDDLGLQNAIKSIYGLSGKLTGHELEFISATWAPYRSVASWYLWRYLDVKP